MAPLTLDEHVEVLVILACHVGGHARVSPRIRDLRGLDLEQPSFAEDADTQVGGHGLEVERGGTEVRTEGQKAPR